ncbi:MAG TPA: amidohydrolase family protein [Gemmatimonadales bacterium]|nr:amidohydrolase family protein [Gemmatimonadales bacterium]
MLLALVTAMLVQTPPLPHRVLIRDVTIVSPERKAPLQHGYVVLENDRIAAVGHGTPPVAPWDSVVVGRGRVLIPGLIDGHTHLAVTAGMPLPVPPELRSLAAAYAEQLPRSYLYSGFTTVIDLIVFDRAFLNRFKAAPLHPDSYDCGPALALANGYPMAMSSQNLRWDLFPNFLWDPRQRDSIPSRFRPEDHTPKATVARVAADGGVCVKTFEEHGYGPVRNLPTPTLEMIRAVVRESHARDLPVLMHANTLAAWRFAVHARVDVIAHGMWNWDEFEHTGEELPAPIRALLDTVAARRIGFMPTLRVIDGLGDMYDPAFLDNPRLARVLPSSLIAWYQTPAGQSFAAEMRRNFGKASNEQVRGIFRHVADHGATATRYLVSHGGRLVFGTDTPSSPTYGNPPGLNGFLELERLAGAGVPLPRLLGGATIEAARAFHLDSLYGTVEAGKVANLVLLRANPLETVEAYDAIDQVVVRGKVLDRSVLAAR